MCRYPFFLLLLLFVSCEETSAPFSTYRPLDDRDSVRWASIRQWQGGPPPAWEPLLWRYQLGDTTETLHYDLRPLPAPDSLVRLPHRLVHPNRAMWYRTRVRFGHDQLLFVNADDGAQVFVGGAQVPQALPNSFRIPATEDSVDLHIRVLNNAMAGGLRQARFFPWTEGFDYFSRQDWAAQLLAGKTPWDTAAQTQPLLIAEPYWQRRADGQYRLRFVTAATGPATLHWGRSAGELTETRQPSLAEGGVFEFAWPASELPDTCFYQLRQGGSQSPVYHWSTAAERAGFTFTAWGDSQGGWPTFARLSRLMAADHPDFSIGLGDLVSDGALHTQWFDFLASLGPVAGQTVVYPVVGNHDYDGFYDDLIPALYQRYIREDTYFAWRYRNCYFVALDPNEQFPLGFSDKQQAWLRAQMASPEWQSAEWRFLLLHQPPYSQGWPGYHGDAFIRELVEAEAEAAGIDFVLSGHSHCYERLSKAFGGQATHFLTMGGAGGGLEPPEDSDYPAMDTLIKAHHYGLFAVEGPRIHFRVIGLEGEVLDEVVFEK